MSELAGIIRNGLERGWPIEEVKNSLVNSGYPIQEIDSEIKCMVPSSPQSTTLPIKKVDSSSQNSNLQKLSNYQSPSVNFKESKRSNKILITIIVLLVLCVFAGAGLYLFG